MNWHKITVHRARSPFYTRDILYASENKKFKHFIISSEDFDTSELVQEAYSTELDFLGAYDNYLLFYTNSKVWIVK
jgi:hypothetical protein